MRCGCCSAMSDDEQDVCTHHEYECEEALTSPQEMPKETVGKPVIRDANGRFLKGTANGPGRPKGSKDKLNQQVISSLEKLWHERGQELLDQLSAEKPEVVMAMISRMIPQQLAAEAITGEEQAAAEVNKDITIRLVQQVQEDQALTSTPRLVEGELMDDDEVITH